MKNLKYALESINKFQNEVQKNGLRPKNISKIYEQNLPSIARIIGESIDELPNSLKTVANHGWYRLLEMSPSETHLLATEINKGNLQKVDKQMIEFIEESLHEIKVSLLARHPNRSSILNSAFKNHFEEDYNSSVPLFLSQTEGICIEYTDVKLYGSTNKGIPRIAEMIKNLPQSDIITILMQPLMQQGLITASKFQRSEFRGNINRHEILHGLSVDYGSKINSFKPISWINYISKTFHSAFRQK